MKDKGKRVNSGQWTVDSGRWTVVSRQSSEVVEGDGIALAPCAAKRNVGYTSPSVWECVKHTA